MSNHESCVRWGDSFCRHPHDCDPIEKPPPDLVTVPRAELEAIRDALSRIDGMIFPAPSRAGIYVDCVRSFATTALAKLEAHLKGQP